MRMREKGYWNTMILQPFYLDQLIQTALQEDIHYVDVTTDYLLDDDHVSEAYYIARMTAFSAELTLPNGYLNWLAEPVRCRFWCMMENRCARGIFLPQ